MKQKASDNRLQVIARAPFKIYYEGEAKMVSAANPVGKFDVLPGHADFFSVLIPGPVDIETDQDVINFDISNGIISVQGEEVILFVNM
jgi:F0F1-type ATP synthase epsilon subunit